MLGFIYYSKFCLVQYSLQTDKNSVYTRAGRASIDFAKTDDSDMDFICCEKKAADFGEAGQNSAWFSGARADKSLNLREDAFPFLRQQHDVWGFRHANKLFFFRTDARNNHFAALRRNALVLAANEYEQRWVPRQLFLTTD